MTGFIYVVDMQRDFMPFDGSALPVPGGDSTIAPINEKLRNADPEDCELILVSEDSHEPSFTEYMPDGTPFPKHCVLGTEGAETIVDLTRVDPRIPIYLIRKNAFSVWEETTIPVLDYRTKRPIAFDRDEFFALLKNDGTTNVDLVGVCSDICVSLAGKGLIERGFNITVDRLAVKGLFREIDQVNEEDWGGKATLI